MPAPRCHSGEATEFTHEMRLIAVARRHGDFHRPPIASQQQLPRAFEAQPAQVLLWTDADVLHETSLQGAQADTRLVGQGGRRRQCRSPLQPLQQPGHAVQPQRRKSGDQTRIGATATGGKVPIVAPPVERWTPRLCGQRRKLGTVVGQQRATAARPAAETIRRARSGCRTDPVGRRPEPRWRESSCRPSASAATCRKNRRSDRRSHQGESAAWPARRRPRCRCSSKRQSTLATTAMARIPGSSCEHLAMPQKGAGRIFLR